MKRNSGDASRGAQNFHLTGQTPQGLMGLEANLGHPYAAGSGFPVGKHGGGYNSNRLQNAINSNRNRYFQHQFVNEMPESMSNRMLQGIQGGQFNSMDQQQQYGVNRFYMNGNRRVPRSFKPPSAHGVPFDSMLPSIPGQFDMPDDLDEEEGNYRYKYNNKSKQDSDEYNTIDLIGKYAKYYRAQEYQNEQNKQMKAVPTSNDKNNELVSRYLKHAAKKQVRSTSINVPKYTGDYDPDVFVTGKLQSDENISQSSLTQPSEEEINRESLFNKQEAAAEQKFRLEKANFPAPSSLNNATSTDTNSEKAKYKLKYTKRKKMVIASTSDKENDPSMLVKGGGDEVTLGNDDEVPTPTEQEKKVIEFTAEKEKPIIHEEIIEQAAAVRVPTAKKIIKKMRRQSVTPKLVPEKEAEKKVEVSNKQQQPELTNKPKATKSVDIRKQIKKVTIEKVKRIVPVVSTKNEEQPTDNKEETEENDNLQSTVEEEQLPCLESDSYHITNGGSEEELQFANDDDDEKLAQQRADEELNAILAPLRAQVPDHIRISPTLGFLPIMPVTFSWFPMSQQHKEAFQKMSEQSKFPNSLRPFQRFAAT